MTRGKQRTVSTDDIGTDDWAGFLDMTEDAPGARAIEVVDKSPREFEDLAEYEAFMNLPVGIEISGSTDPRESQVVPVGCNGDQKWLPREAKIVVRRYMVERLLRAATTDYSIMKVDNPDADEGQRMHARTKRPYTVTIHKDPHPMGTRWAERIRHEPA